MCLEDYLPKNGSEREIYEKLLAGEEISKEEAYVIGKDAENYENLPYKCAFMRDDLIGRNGVHSVVFPVSPRESELVAKFPKVPQDWWKVKRGQIMQTLAYNEQVKVAKPEGIFKLFDLSTKKFYSGFVMKHLGMLPLNEIRSLKEQICENMNSFNFDYNGLMEKLEKSCISLKELHNKALSEYELAKEEAELKGFSNIDYRETNAFWIP